MIGYIQIKEAFCDDCKKDLHTRDGWGYIPEGSEKHYCIDCAIKRGLLDPLEWINLHGCSGLKWDHADYKDGVVTGYIIDDLFARTDKKSTEFAMLLFDMMINYSSTFEIVVTANLTKEEMINPPPDKARIISRLRELCAVVETGAKDRRSLVMASCMNPQSNGEHREQAQKNVISENRIKNVSGIDLSHKDDGNDPEPIRGTPEWYAWADRHDEDNDEEEEQK